MLRWMIVAAVAASMIGCSTVRRVFERDNEPPTASNGVANYGGRTGNTSVLVATFTNPERATVRYRRIGSGISDAMSRVLFEKTDLDVWIDPELSGSAGAALRRAGLGSSTTGLPQRARSVNYIVTGRVTDFHHTGELHGAERDEAVVAIDFQLIDARTGRVVAADHVRGVERNRDGPARELYRDIPFGSYIFWQTPLGEATDKAINTAVARLIRVIPDRVGDPYVEALVSHRGARIAGGSQWGLSAGQEYYLCRRPTPEAAWEPIRDADLHQPIRVRITEVARSSASAWVIGQAPVEIDLRGAVLRRELPATPAREQVSSR